MHSRARRVVSLNPSIAVGGSSSLTKALHTRLRATLRDGATGLSSNTRTIQDASAALPTELPWSLVRAVSVAMPNATTRAHASLLSSVARLPASAAAPQFAAALSSHQCTLVSGPPGCGKSTQLPRIALSLADHAADQTALHDSASHRLDGVDCPVTLTGAPLGGTDSSSPTILVSVPRRVAAETLATRVACELEGPGAAVGGVVGCAARFATRVSTSTRLLYATHGVVLKRLQKDPLLRGVAVVFVDEVHERGADGDLVLRCVAAAAAARPGLRVVAMSATVDTERVKKFFEVEGRWLTWGGGGGGRSEGAADSMQSSMTVHPMTIRGDAASNLPAPDGGASTAPLQEHSQAVGLTPPSPPPLHLRPRRVRRSAQHEMAGSAFLQASAFKGVARSIITLRDEDEEVGGVGHGPRPHRTAQSSLPQDNAVGVEQSVEGRQSSVMAGDGAVPPNSGGVGGTAFCAAVAADASPAEPFTFEIASPPLHRVNIMHLEDLVSVNPSARERLAATGRRSAHVGRAPHGDSSVIPQSNSLNTDGDAGFNVDAWLGGGAEAAHCDPTHPHQRNPPLHSGGSSALMSLPQAELQAGGAYPLSHPLHPLFSKWTAPRPYGVAVDVAMVCHALETGLSHGPPGHALVFLPGWSALLAVSKELRRRAAQRGESSGDPWTSMEGWGRRDALEDDDDAGDADADEGDDTETKDVANIGGDDGQAVGGRKVGRGSAPRPQRAPQDARLSRGAAAHRRSGEVIGDLFVVLLHSKAGDAAQQAAFADPPAGLRKVVLATDVAEAAVTIDGVGVVVDTCVSRSVEVDPRTSAQRWRTVLCSQSSLVQRAGRCGRTTEGCVIRLIPAALVKYLPTRPLPELQGGALAPVLLRVAALAAAAPTLAARLSPLLMRKLPQPFRLPPTPISSEHTPPPPQRAATTSHLSLSSATQPTSETVVGPLAVAVGLIAALPDGPSQASLLAACERLLAIGALAHQHTPSPHPPSNAELTPSTAAETPLHSAVPSVDHSSPAAAEVESTGSSPSHLSFLGSAAGISPPPTPSSHSSTAKVSTSPPSSIASHLPTQPPLLTLPSSPLALTPLGHLLAQLPVPPEAAKLVIWGCMLGCPAPALTVAATLVVGHPFSLSTHTTADFATQRRVELANGSLSDFTAAHNAFLAWRHSGRSEDFAVGSHLAHTTLLRIEAMRKQLLTSAVAAGLLHPRVAAVAADVVAASPKLAAVAAGAARQRSDGEQAYGHGAGGWVGSLAPWATLSPHATPSAAAAVAGRNNASTAVLSAAVCAALFPNVAMVDVPADARVRRAVAGAVDSWTAGPTAVTIFRRAQRSQLRDIPVHEDRRQLRDREEVVAVGEIALRLPSGAGVDVLPHSVNSWNALHDPSDSVGSTLNWMAYGTLLEQQRGPSGPTDGSAPPSRAAVSHPRSSEAAPASTNEAPASRCAVADTCFVSDAAVLTLCGDVQVQRTGVEDALAEVGLQRPFGGRTSHASPHSSDSSDAHDGADVLNPLVDVVVPRVANQLTGRMAALRLGFTNGVSSPSHSWTPSATTFPIARAGLLESVLPDSAEVAAIELECPAVVAACLLRARLCVTALMCGDLSATDNAFTSPTSPNTKPSEAMSGVVLRRGGVDVNAIVDGVVKMIVGRR